MSELDAGGQYVTAGWALVGMGALGCILAATMYAAVGPDAGFITPPAAATIGGVTSLLGAWMIHTGRRLARD